MIIDFLIRNYEWFHLIALCLIWGSLLTCVFMFPKLNPLMSMRSDLQGSLFYMGLINDNPPTGGNPRIEQMLDYAIYLSGLEHSVRGARPVIVTGSVFSLAMAVQGVLMMTVSDTVEDPYLVMEWALSYALSLIYLMLSLLPLVVCWSNRLYAAKLRRAAGKATAEYYLMLSESLPQSGQEDDTEAAYENETEKDRRESAI